MDDLISRQAALNEIAEWMLEYGALNEKRERDALQHIARGIKKLPSVQPEIIRCKDCKYNASTHKCINPDSFFLIPSDDDFCSYAERKTDCHIRAY